MNLNSLSLVSIESDRKQINLLDFVSKHACIFFLFSFGFGFAFLLHRTIQNNLSTTITHNT